MRCPGIDFAVGGHTHRGYQKPWIDPMNHTLCFETFGNGSSIGHVILLVDRKTQRARGLRAGPRQRHAGDPLRGRDVAGSDDRRPCSSPTRDAPTPRWAEVGRPPPRMTRGGAGSNLVGNLVTDAMREYFNADFALQNLGGLRADLPAGDRSRPATSSACCRSATNWS